MRKEQFIHDFSRRLANLGLPAGRLTQEISEHWDDLEQEASEQKLAPEPFASERIGTVDSLVAAHSVAMRKAHWCGRHPIISFAILPPVALVAWYLGWGLMAAGAGELYGKLLGLQQPFWSTFLLVLIIAKVIHYTGVLVIPALFCWWARRSFCGHKWSWVACVACAFHGLLNHVTIHAHSLHWGYGIAVPDLLPVIVPLAVGTTSQLYPGLTWRLAVTVALLALTGCASAKPTHERGWIGGEYKTVRANTGVLVTRVYTNSPAARGGLLEGDVIVAADGQKIKKLEEFWRRVENVQPGNALALTLCRNGNTIDETVILGRETFKTDRSIAVGLLFAHEFDPLPNPDFSFVALGFKHQHQRLDLASPESRLERSSHAGGCGIHSREGWEFWLPVMSFSNRKAILSQTLVE